MAQLTQLDQILSYGDTTYIQVPASGEVTQVPLGTKAWDAAGNLYVWASGVGSTILGSLVVFDKSWGTALITDSTVGLVGVAQSANNATTSFGWYMVYGVTTTAQTADTTINTAIYSTATAGKVSNTSSAHVQVKGAFSAATTTGTKTVGTTMLSFPTIGI